MLMPIALTDSEMDIVLAAARPLAVQDRDPFLRAVAELLEAMPERGDGIVHRLRCSPVFRRRRFNLRTADACDVTRRRYSRARAYRAGAGRACRDPGTVKKHGQA
jgi:hypothetical protein